MSPEENIDWDGNIVAVQSSAITRDANSVIVEKDSEAKPAGQATTDDIVYPTGLRVVLLVTSALIALFLIALDRLIISTALPEITDAFHSVTDFGWYGSAYLLSACSFQLLFGKLYTFYSVKTIFLSAVALFEIGSAVCGAAPSSVAFILGRVIAGVGAAGISSGGIVILVYAVPLHQRPIIQGLAGAVFGLASIVGPLLGGALTSRVSWRWCFYINLPFGAVVALFITFLLHVPDRQTTHLPTRVKLSQLDVVGTSVFIPGTVCILLALEWGGVQYTWQNWRIVVLLTLGSILLVAFIIIQILLPETATVPPRIFTQRSIYSGFFASFTSNASLLLFVYFLSIWFQAIKGLSAVDSGVRLLPMILAVVVASIVAGILTTRLGYYTPIMICGVCISCVGAGLLTTFHVDTPRSKWVGYQFLYGWGLGLGFQAPNLAAQTVLSAVDVPIGTSLMYFAQLFGGAVFLSVGQTVLNNRLLDGLEVIPEFNATSITTNGATTITDLPNEVKEQVLEVYDGALQKVFQVALILSCLTIIGAHGMEWRSVKEGGEANPNGNASEGDVVGDKVPPSEEEVK